MITYEQIIKFISEIDSPTAEAILAIDMTDEQRSRFVNELMKHYDMADLK